VGYKLYLLFPILISRFKRGTDINKQDIILREKIFNWKNGKFKALFDISKKMNSNNIQNNKRIIPSTLEEMKKNNRRRCFNHCSTGNYKKGMRSLESKGLVDLTKEENAINLKSKYRDFDVDTKYTKIKELNLEIELERIDNQIIKLDNNKSGGPDGINTKIIKQMWNIKKEQILINS